MRRGLLDPLFRYIPASTHDASSLAFRRRQQQRLREAQDVAAVAQVAEAAKKVQPIARKKAAA